MMMVPKNHRSIDIMKHVSAKQLQDMRQLRLDQAKQKKRRLSTR
jgi:hypothetical protein